VDGKDLLRGRVRCYEKTDTIKAQQLALIEDEYNRCLRIAFTTCADPRVDLTDVVENAYGRLCADWVCRQDEPVKWLHELARVSLMGWSVDRMCPSD
jgi:hypothetical protein